jgi:hypothetical protein
MLYFILVLLLTLSVVVATILLILHFVRNRETSDFEI